MGLILNGSPVVGAGAQTLLLSQYLQASTGANWTYLVLNGFDRNEYTTAASGETGSFLGNGQSMGLDTSNGDASEAGIVFTYSASSGRYYSNTYGYLDQLSFETSSSVGDITDLSLFGTNSLSVARHYGQDPLSLSQMDPSGYLGTLTVATEPGFAGPVPAQATPLSIAAVAESFVGDAWNMNGCWVLASTIAAEAGASLPVQSTAAMAGQSNGEWFVAYNGPTGAVGDWRSMVRPGDMIGFITGSGGGHITTCVSGAGSTALLVDNITLVNSAGTVVDSANDGSADDVIVQAPHLASEEWAGVQPGNVVIYRLDTPVVTAATQEVELGGLGRDALSALFSAADPAGRSVVAYQVSTGGGTDQIAYGGALLTAAGPAEAVTVSALSAADLVRGSAGGADTVSVRAFNGSWWGDWTTISIYGAGVQTAAPPSVTQTVATLPTGDPSPASGSTSPGSGSVPPITADTVAVTRFFDESDGTHFFTSSASEIADILATRPDLKDEGVGMQAYAAASDSSAAEPVYRFFDMTDGTHFFTASAGEEATILATRPDMRLEGVAFYEDSSPQAGDVAVYRFFDSVHGTHLFTDNASEAASIVATRPDLRAEGIAFYAPS